MKIQKIQPCPIKISGHRVIISDTIFSEIVKIINEQSATINALIDAQKADRTAITEIAKAIKH